MIEVKGDLWKYPCDWLCITTNGIVKNDGSAVMGKGCALEATKRFWDIQMILGDKIKTEGNKVHHLKTFGREDYVPKREGIWDKWVACHVFSFPTKHSYKDDADIKLIEQSCDQLMRKYQTAVVSGKVSLKTSVFCPPIVLLPRAGCGCGGLNWEKEVKPIFEKYFTNDDFIVISN